ncbi:uncharacterized protein LOC127431345 isoform X2 [Myxocyprinus asiaticus]|uniref:uncharacterized protein LOC127431345 isoform X2 n=1 Tax=Myxocyprinus asiaticus TaxID=70543 RepID=UPI002222975E|nr:uncharacterized protein LOC127431345 isoform X2 [Myxocyprinus asiaticus]
MPRDEARTAPGNGVTARTAPSREVPCVLEDSWVASTNFCSPVSASVLAWGMSGGSLISATETEEACSSSRTSSYSSSRKCHSSSWSSAWFILTGIFIEMYGTSLCYGSYVFLTWGKALGVCMGASYLQILIWAIVAISKESGTLKDHFKKSIHPLNTCRVNNLNANTEEQRVEPEREEGPFTVNLTQADFTAVNWEAISEA